MSDARVSAVRELFIEELAEGTGGVDGPLCSIKDWFQTTHACCEEGPDGCCP